jgi:hypothetical protein
MPDAISQTHLDDDDRGSAECSVAALFLLRHSTIRVTLDTYTQG